MELSQMMYNAGNDGELEFKGGHCPICTEANIEIELYFEDSASQVCGESFCFKCKIQWRIYYKLAGYKMFISQET